MMKNIDKTDYPGPIIFPTSKVLILGSYPGGNSKKLERYYADNSNYFWKILSNYTGMDNPNLIDAEYEEKVQLSKDILEKSNIAIWDMYESCVRKTEEGKESSLDKHIKKEVWNDIPKLLNRYPNIQWIGIAGEKNYNKFKNHFPNIGLFVFQVPSTSNSSPSCGDDKTMPVWRDWNALLNSINKE